MRPRSRLRRLLLSMFAAALTVPVLAADAMKVPVYPSYVYPPWQKGANNDAAERGVAFTVPEVDNLPDFHGNPIDAKLVLYVGGNYYFALAPLVTAFEAGNPDLRGRIFWETLPPGVLAKQMDAGGTITVGNMTFTVKPDAYFAGLAAVQRLVDSGKLEAPAVPYVSNVLAIMVPKGNPARVASLTDLARSDIRLAMPNPDTEGVTDQIKDSLKKAGGEALVSSVYGTKVGDGSTYLTAIHHRETPMFLMQGRADAGVTWRSEAIFQEQAGNPIAHVDIPPAQNATGVYAGAVVKGAAHADAAKKWLAFLKSPAALKIFASYGFQAYTR
jgi:ABC-type molybdate transport system substrate-binding protein